MKPETIARIAFSLLMPLVRESIKNPDKKKKAKKALLEAAASARKFADAVDELYAVE